MCWYLEIFKPILYLCSKSKQTKFKPQKGVHMKFTALPTADTELASSMFGVNMYMASASGFGPEDEDEDDDMDEDLFDDNEDDSDDDELDFLEDSDLEDFDTYDEEDEEDFY